MTGTKAMDSRFRGNDGIHGIPPRYRHSRESGNPVLLSDRQGATARETARFDALSAQAYNKCEGFR
jgi:hypothetical protein